MLDAERWPTSASPLSMMFLSVTPMGGRTGMALRECEALVRAPQGRARRRDRRSPARVRAARRFHRQTVGSDATAYGAAAPEGQRFWPSARDHVGTLSEVDMVQGRARLVRGRGYTARYVGRVGRPRAGRARAAYQSRQLARQLSRTREGTSSSVSSFIPNPKRDELVQPYGWPEPLPQDRGYYEELGKLASIVTQRLRQLRRAQQLEEKARQPRIQIRVEGEPHLLPACPNFGR